MPVKAPRGGKRSDDDNMHKDEEAKKFSLQLSQTEISSRLCGR